MKTLDIIKDSTKFRTLFAENPDLPICVLVGGDISEYSDSYWNYSSNVCFYVDEILDCEVPGSDTVFDDKDDLRAHLYDWYADDYDSSNEKYDALIEAKMSRYEPYWKKVIVIRVDS